jgi:uncharacterized membrane protein
VIAFFVVASSQLVQVITQVSSQVVILILLLVLFMAMVGMMMANKDLTEGKEILGHSWRVGFAVAILVGISLIFLNALGWLDVIYNFLKLHWDNQLVATVILLGIVIGAILLITGGGPKTTTVQGGNAPANPPGI